MTRTTAVAAVVMLAGAAPAQSQLVSGRVIEEGTDRPIAAVTIELTDSSGVQRATTASDTAGEFRLLAPMPGRYVLRVTHIAYAPMGTHEINAEAGTEIRLELRLSPGAVALEPLRVVGQVAFHAGWLQEYYDRAAMTRRTGMGRVFFRDEIERARMPYASAYLNYLMPRGGCRPTLFVDGLEVADARQLDAMMQVDMLEGVELYNGATTMPQRYMNRGYCAIALFWTRRDPAGARPFTWKRALIGVGLFGIGVLLFAR